jgi:hypothetical protein
LTRCEWLPGAGNKVVFDKKLTCDNEECECRTPVYDGFGAIISNPE